MKQLERKTKNMVAAQQSQFYLSKYTASKLVSQLDTSAIKPTPKSK